MKKIIKGLGFGFVALALSLSLAGSASATTTVAVNAITETGALTITGGTTLDLVSAAGSAITIGAAQVAGTMNIGGTAGIGAISIGASTGAQAINLGTGNAVKTIIIGNATAGGASVTTIHAGTGGLNLGTTADARTISIGTGAAIQTVNIATGNVANVVSIGDNTGATAGSILLGGSTTVNGAFNYILDTGAADVYVATLAPAATGYVAGLELHMKVANVNATTTPTVNVNGLGAKTIVKRAATALAAGDMPAGAIAVLIYDGTNFQLINPVVN